jgi:hypothetical protein
METSRLKGFWLHRWADLGAAFVALDMIWRFATRPLIDHGHGERHARLGALRRQEEVRPLAKAEIGCSSDATRRAAPCSAMTGHPISSPRRRPAPARTSARRPVFQGMPWKAGRHENWGIFNRHIWGVYVRHSHKLPPGEALVYDAQGESAKPIGTKKPRRCSGASSYVGAHDPPAIARVARTRAGRVRPLACPAVASVLYLLYEFAALGPLAPVERAFALMAGCGVQLWLTRRVCELAASPSGSRHMNRTRARCFPMAGTTRQPSTATGRHLRSDPTSSPKRVFNACSQGVDFATLRLT